MVNYTTRFRNAGLLLSGRQISALPSIIFNVGGSFFAMCTIAFVRKNGYDYNNLSDGRLYDSANGFMKALYKITPTDNLFIQIFVPMLLTCYWLFHLIYISCAGENLKKVSFRFMLIEAVMVFCYGLMAAAGLAGIDNWGCDRIVANSDPIARPTRNGVGANCAILKLAAGMNIGGGFFWLLSLSFQIAIFFHLLTDHKGDERRTQGEPQYVNEDVQRDEESGPSYELQETVLSSPSEPAPAYTNKGRTPDSHPTEKK